MYLILKRLFDIMFSFFLIFLLFPVFLVVSLMIFLDLRSNPFFYQKRAGLYCQKFNVIKFKTMNDFRDTDGKLLPDSFRVTRLGYYIRRFSFDELPQLINVFKGDMSFIGPRPFLYEYMDIYSASEKKRHNVRPGITGWAQVNGRNTISWKDKFKLDLFYVEHISWHLDLKILFLTFIKIFKANDVNQNKNFTMEKYNGKN